MVQLAHHSFLAILAVQHWGSRGLGNSTEHWSEHWEDFGHSAEFVDADQSYRWVRRFAGVSVQHAWGEPAHFASQAHATLPLFSGAMSSLELEFLEPHCQQRTYLVRLTDTDDRVFRLVLQPEAPKPPLSTCRNPWIHVHRPALAHWEVYALESRLTPPDQAFQTSMVARADSSAQGLASRLVISERRYPFDLAQAVFEEAAQVQDPQDVRLAQYLILSRKFATLVTRLVQRARQSLVLLSAQMLSERAGNRVLEHWARRAGRDFPAYIILRSALVYDRIDFRFVMHLKGLSVDERLGYFLTGSFEDNGPLRQEAVVRWEDTVRVRQWAQLLFGVLHPAAAANSLEADVVSNQPPPLAVRVEGQSRDAYYDQIVRQAWRRTDPVSEMLNHFLRACTHPLVLTLLQLPSADFMESLRRSPTREIILFEGMEDQHRQRLDEMIRALRQRRPDLQIHWLRVRARGGESTLHFRGYLEVGHGCLIGEGSPTELGSKYSDRALVRAQGGEEICRSLESFYRRLSGDPRSAESDISTVLPLRFGSRRLDLEVIPHLEDRWPSRPLPPAERWRYLGPVWDDQRPHASRVPSDFRAA